MKLSIISCMLVVILFALMPQAIADVIKNGSFEADGYISDITVTAPQQWEVNLVVVPCEFFSSIRQ